MSEKASVEPNGPVEMAVRELARRKGFVLRRAHEGVDLWHIMTPGIDGNLYSFSTANPRSFTLDQARALLETKPDEASG